MGQQPSILELQRMLYQQLVGEPMAIKDGATAATQLSILKAACIGKNWLVVLDDVWDKEHEKTLNCIDSDSTSKLLVTTRIRGLIQGCEEVSLNLLSPGESVDLLLRTALVKDADEAAKAAAGISISRAPPTRRPGVPIQVVMLRKCGSGCVSS